MSSQPVALGPEGVGGSARLLPEGSGGALASLRHRIRATPWWALVGGCLALAFVALALLGEALGPGPIGPASSSYATDARGVAAWAELLSRGGHPVSQLRTALADARLDPADTVVVLDPEALLPAEGARLRAFMRAGGRLVFGGSESQSALPALIAHPPPWSASGATRELAVAGAGATVAGVGEVRSAGEGEWSVSAGYRAPLRSLASGSLLLERDFGAGTLELLADASPLQNRLLASADDAQLAINLAGERARPVMFVESVHGFGLSRGLAALPGRWRLAFALLALAGLLWVIARGRRLGPAEQERSAEHPPRSAYMEALALLLGRTKDPRKLSSELTRLRDGR
ncbi:MAG TPA: DUF4350 domain-containing protein [Solirubrobacteraceae bacterium]|nr:DUF4350 domain-containing protein [Solirubrobacteraceae bacterium]